MVKTIYIFYLFKKVVIWAQIGRLIPFAVLQIYARPPEGAPIRVRHFPRWRPYRGTESLSLTNWFDKVKMQYVQNTKDSTIPSSARSSSFER